MPHCHGKLYRRRTIQRFGEQNFIFLESRVGQKQASERRKQETAQDFAPPTGCLRNKRKSLRCQDFQYSAGARDGGSIQTWQFSVNYLERRADKNRCWPAEALERRNFPMVLELLRRCGMISEAGSQISTDCLRSFGLSTDKVYSSAIIRKLEPFREAVRLMTLNG